MQEFRMQGCRNLECRDAGIIGAVMKRSFFNLRKSAGNLRKSARKSTREVED